jgi:hypothetical protein
MCHLLVWRIGTFYRELLPLSSYQNLDITQGMGWGGGRNDELQRMYMKMR